MRLFGAGEGSIYLQCIMCDEAVICGGVNTLVLSHGHLPRTAEEALLPKARRGGRQMWVIRGGGSRLRVSNEVPRLLAIEIDSSPFCLVR